MPCASDCWSTCRLLAVMSLLSCCRSVCHCCGVGFPGSIFKGADAEMWFSCSFCWLIVGNCHNDVVSLMLPALVQGSLMFSWCLHCICTYVGVVLLGVVFLHPRPALLMGVVSTFLEIPSGFVSISPTGPRMNMPQINKNG